VFLFIGILMYLAIVAYLMFYAPKAEQPVEYPIGRAHENAQRPPAVLERWPVWIALTVVLILIAYLFPIMDMIRHAPPGSPPVRTW
jgi:cytochrome c oxidase subunit 1